MKLSWLLFEHIHDTRMDLTGPTTSNAAKGAFVVPSKPEGAKFEREDWTRRRRRSRGGKGAAPGSRPTLDMQLQGIVEALRKVRGSRKRRHDVMDA